MKLAEKLAVFMTAFVFYDLSAQAQTCPHPFVIRAAPDIACPEGSSCSEKSSILTHAELDRWALNEIALCDTVGLFTWPAPASGYFQSDADGSVSIGPIAFATAAGTCTTADTGDSATGFFSTGTLDAARLPALTVNLAAGGSVTGGTASKCAHFNSSGNLVAATGDCAAGDTTGGGGGGAWTTVIKTADETLNFTSTLQDDDALTFAVSANTAYVFRMHVKFNTTSGADFKYSIAGPASPTLVRIDVEEKPGGAAAYAASTTLTSFGNSSTVDGTGANGEIRLEGIAKIGATSGSITLRWTEDNGVSGGPTRVYAGSYLEWALAQ